MHLQPVVDLSDDQQLALGRRESKSRCAEIFKAFKHFELLRLWNERQRLRCPDMVGEIILESDMMRLLKAT